jgi:DNA-binding FrmR family transcriptional regulator
MSHTISEKQNLLLRAKRIRGQIEALVRALDEERELLEGHIRSHVLNGKHKPSSKQVVAADEVIDMVKSYLK